MISKPKVILSIVLICICVISTSAQPAQNRKTAPANSTQYNTVIPKIQDIEYVEYAIGYTGAGSLTNIIYTFDIANLSHKEIITNMLNELKTAKTVKIMNDYGSKEYSPPELALKLYSGKFFYIKAPFSNFKNAAYVKWNDGSKAVCLNCPKTRAFLDKNWKSAKLNHITSMGQLINFRYKSLHMRTIPDEVKFLDIPYRVQYIIRNDSINKEIGVTSDNTYFRVFSIKNITTGSAIAILGNESKPVVYIMANRK